MTIPGKQRSYEPAILPPRWELRRDLFGPYATAFLYPDGLTVICSIARERDGREWLHVSASRPNRIPSWEDMRAVKDIFVGTTRKAVQVFPRVDEYVNDNPNVLHLWCCLDGDPLPDFRRNGTI